MNNQEAFTIVKNHLLTQNCRAEEGSNCLYRGPNGTKCAIGALITDEEFEKVKEANYEHIGVYSLLDLQLKSLEGLDIEFLRGLQNIHDCDQIYRWEYSLKRFAEKYGLNYQ